MFYRLSDATPLPYDPFKAIVAPRPIGWISTLNEQGMPNLAPYSFFNILSVRPHIIYFASHGVKDSLRNARRSGEFVYNVVGSSELEAMVRTSEDVLSDVDEFLLAGIEAAPSKLVSAPRVASSPAALECRVVDAFELKDLDGRATDRHVVLGQVVGVHIKDSLLCDGLFDVARAQPVARCGYHDYHVVREILTVPPGGGRPGPNGDGGDAL